MVWILSFMTCFNHGIYENKCSRDLMTTSRSIFWNKYRRLSNGRNPMVPPLKKPDFDFWRLEDYFDFGDTTKSGQKSLLEIIRIDLVQPRFFSLFSPCLKIFPGGKKLKAKSAWILAWFSWLFFNVNVLCELENWFYCLFPQPQSNFKSK